ncbi:MAG: CPBP family intramembrane metalloprotease [Oligoflexia bacterium]|nr:CPBP family intramembrane metalloprotease [Oligoflexia bacterium]
MSAGDATGPMTRGDRPGPRTPGQARAVLLELTALWLVTLLVIRAVVDLQRGSGLPDWLLAAVPLLFIYAPVVLCRLRGVDSWSYRLSIPAFSDRQSWGQAGRLNAKVLGLILVPWLIGYHFYQSAFFGHAPGDGLRDGVAAALLSVGQAPPQLLERAVDALTTTPDASVAVLAGLQLLTLVAYQLFFVAIPEEFFYRGYFQTRLNELLPRRFLIFGTPMGWGAIVATLYFTFGHSVVHLQWWHFATFFPGLVFSWMRERTGGVIAGAIFHASCNIMVVLMDTCYGVPRGF